MLPPDIIDGKDMPGKIGRVLTSDKFPLRDESYSLRKQTNTDTSYEFVITSTTKALIGGVAGDFISLAISAWIAAENLAEKKRKSAE